MPNTGEVMIRILVIAVLLASASLSSAQEAEELQTLIERHLELFSNEQSRLIAEEIVATPGLFGDFALSTNEDIEMVFDEVFAVIKEDGWDRSVPLSIETCELAEDTALVTLNFSRLRADGEAIPPRVRGAFYLVRKHEAGWRVVAIYNRDPDVTVNCS